MNFLQLSTYQLNVFAFELEADLRHGESVEVPGQLRAGVLDCVLSDLFLLKEVRAVGVALVGFLVDVEALGEPDWTERVLKSAIPRVYIVY